MKLSELIGLSNLKQRAAITIKACERAHIVFPHSLLYGVGGTGKTAFARAIGEELRYYFKEIEAASLKKREGIYELLFNQCWHAYKCDTNLLLFVDEIHQLGLPMQEAFYIPMKEWTIDGKSIPKFTLIGATTRIDKLDANSFLTRFDNQWEIQKYPDQDIALIVAQEFRRYRVGFNKDVVFDIVKRCWGIPRIAVAYARKIWLYVVARGVSAVTMSDISQVFALEEIDSIGLGAVHRTYLRILDSLKLNGERKPASMATIVGKMRQREDVIVGSVEPPLMELDFIASTSRGKIITEKGSKFLAGINSKSSENFLETA